MSVTADINILIQDAIEPKVTLSDPEHSMLDGNPLYRRHMIGVRFFQVVQTTSLYAHAPNCL